MNDTTVQVFDSFQPIKKAGETISLQVGQTLGSSANGADLVATSGTDTVYLQVDGPRLTLPPDLLSGTYPAEGSQDSPDEFLPHIAIDRRTLAWERPGPTPTSPWLAVLLVKESEWREDSQPILHLSASELSNVLVAEAAAPAGIKLAPQPPSKPPVLKPEVLTATLRPASLDTATVVLGGPQLTMRPSLADQVPDATLQSLTIAQIKAHDALAYTQLTDAQKGCGLDPATTVNVMFVPNDVLTQILPAVDELPLLCHVKLGSNDSETLIVVGNRLPNSTLAGGANQPEKHTALLVSLERRSDLYGAGNTRKGSAPAALVVLYKWTFTPSTGADFADAIQSIRYTPNGGVLRFGNRVTVPAPGAAGIATMLAPDGFLSTPLPLAPVGQANYRGPLRPYQAPDRANTFAVSAAPQELLNANPGDPPDYSHATAFELGRLIAVSDSGIMEDLKAVHGVLDLPKGFVATSVIPPALQKKDWGVDPAAHNWSENPWSGTVGDFSQRATADFSGVSSQIAATGPWQAQIGAAYQGQQIQTVGASLGQIATATISAETLEIQLAEVFNAAH
jgi:hypothetical protein